MAHDEQAPRRGHPRGLRARRLWVLIGLVAALVLSALTWTEPAQAVADPVHAVQESIPDSTRGNNVTLTFNPSPTGTVNYIVFSPPYGVTIVSATGCQSTSGLPTTNAFTCVSSQANFGGPITLNLYIGAAPAGDASGTVYVGQTDGTQVQDPWYVNVVYSRAVQQSTPVTTPGSSGSTTFNPDPVHGAIKWVTFDPPAGVTLTGATGCPQASALPTTSTFICYSGGQYWDSPITLSYDVSAGAPVGTALIGAAKVGQWDDLETSDSFTVKTSPGVADPVYAVPESQVNAARGRDVVVIFDPSPSGTVQAIDFAPPPGMTIVSATGCPSTSGLPTSSVYHCAPSTWNYAAAIRLTVHIDATAPAGNGVGFAGVAQTDGNLVSKQWFVQTVDTRAVQQGAPVTAAGDVGTTTFNPQPAGAVHWVTFDPPAGVTITGATGCPQAGALPTTSTFVCLSGAQDFDSPITLTYSVASSAATHATLTGSVKVDQADDSVVPDTFAVITPAAATKVTAVHVPQPSAYGQASSVKVTVARDGSTGAAPTGTVSLTTASGTVVATGQLVNGVATLALSRKLAVGTRTLTAKYVPTDEFAASQAPVTVTVKKAATTTKASAKKRYAFRKDFRVKVTVTAAGVVPHGKVKITYKGKVIGKGKLRSGKVAIKVKKNLKVGKRKLVVKYLGSAKTLPSKRVVRVKII